MAPDPLTELRDRLRAFASERDWQQFHAPKNLAMALSVEVAVRALNAQLTAGAGRRRGGNARPGDDGCRGGNGRWASA